MDPGGHGHERLPAGDVRRLPALQHLPEPVPVKIRLVCSNQAIGPIIYPPPVSDNGAVATLKCKCATASRRREFLFELRVADMEGQNFSYGYLPAAERWC